MPVECSQVVLGNNGVGRIIVGNMENIRNDTKEQISAIIDYGYTPKNSIIVVVGDVNYDQVLNEVRNNFSDWENEKVRPYYEDIRSKLEIYFDRVENSQNSVISISFKTYGYIDKIKYLINIISTILGGREISSRLIEEIRNKRGLSYDLGSFVNYCSDKGTLGFTVICSNEDVSEVVKIMLR